MDVEETQTHTGLPPVPRELEGESQVKLQGGALLVDSSRSTVSKFGGRYRPTTR